VQRRPLSVLIALCSETDSLEDSITLVFLFESNSRRRGNMFKPVEGGRPNTVKSRVSAGKLFDSKFQPQQNETCPRMEGLSLDDLDTEEKRENVKKEIKCFGSFLLQHKYDEENNYACGSQTTILSGLINGLRVKFPHLNMFKVGDKKQNIPAHEEARWYIKLVCDMKITGRVAAIKRGESIAGSSNSIR
jgi:hypothetical protein